MPDLLVRGVGVRFRWSRVGGITVRGVKVRFGGEGSGGYGSGLAGLR